MGLFGNNLPKEVRAEIERMDRKIITEPNNIKFFIEKANLLFLYDATKEARKVLESALQVDLNNIECLSHMSVLYMYDKKENESLNYAKKIIEIHKPNVEVVDNLIQDSFIRHCLNLALFWCDQSAILEPNELEWKLKRSHILLEFGKYKETIQLLDEILDKYPKNAYALNMKGKSLRKKGKTKQAIEIFNTVLAVNEDLVSLNGIGFALTKSGNAKDAESYHKRVLDHDPDNIDALNGLGYALTHYKEFLKGHNRQKEALAYLEKSKELESKYSDTWTYLAELFESKGQFQNDMKSIECWFNASVLDLTEYANEKYRKKSGQRKRDMAFKFTKSATKFGIRTGFKLTS